MDLALFRKVIDEASRWVHDVNLHHRGESTLHPRFLDMVAYAGERGVYTKLHTNATRLDRNMAQAILNSPLDLISFSFDGYDKATYQHYRSPADFETTLGNIRRFLEMKKERGGEKPITIVEVMDLTNGQGAFSPDKRRAFVKSFNGLALNKFVVKKPHNWAGSIDLVGKNSKAGLVPCTFLWHSLVVAWDGKVGPCPHDYMGEIVLGDASRQSLAEIFNCPGLVRLRRQMITGILAQTLPCYRCDSINRPAIFGVPLSSLKYLRF